MTTIDLRSDTVTLPSPSMRRAMAEAELGDDVYGEDPTINRLQEKSAALVGKEAGLFLPSGTMGNLVAVLAHCGRGDEVIMGKLGHTFLFEAGGVSALGGVHPNTLPNLPDGTIDLNAIQDAIRQPDVHFPTTRLIILENTHNRCGGVPVSAEYTAAVGDIVRKNALSLHIDGARIFNAAVALKTTAAELARPADSITFCLSKGLAAPVGSVLCGSMEFIARALRIRKQLGGGMRQAGVLAAAGIIALDEMIDRLEDDHTRAAALAAGLDGIPGLLLEPKIPPTNMVFMTLAEGISKNAAQVATELLECGVKVGVVNPRRIRMVLHYGIEDSDVTRTIQAFEKILKAS